MNKICYWDEKEGCQKERDATPEEQEEIDSRKLSSEDINRPIIAQLERIDAKSIRALRECNQDRINSLESEASALRSQLIK